MRLEAEHRDSSVSSAGQTTEHMSPERVLKLSLAFSVMQFLLTDWLSKHADINRIQHISISLH